MIEIKEITEMTQAVYDRICELLPQLSKNAVIPSWDEVKEIVETKTTILLAAYETDRPDVLLGCMTLVLFRIPTGIRAWIEDVVVDNEVRGQGIGEKIIKAAMDRARLEGAKTLDLTSRPTREAANRLYRRCGFELRETNVYRFMVYGKD